MAADAGGVRLSQSTNWGQQRWPGKQTQCPVVKGEVESVGLSLRGLCSAVSNAFKKFHRGAARERRDGAEDFKTGTAITFHQLAFNAGYRLSCAVARKRREVARRSHL